MAVSSYNYQRSPTFLNKKTTSNHAQGERKVLLMALLAHYITASQSRYVMIFRSEKPQAYEASGLYQILL
ncbi:hypothetical protein DVQ31_17820 [Yersinia enterocolitica]|nr:hypothetical protein [Yersinia enterocolitica]